MMTSGWRRVLSRAVLLTMSLALAGCGGDDDDDAAGDDGPLIVTAVDGADAETPDGGDDQAGDDASGSDEAVDRLLPTEAVGPSAGTDQPERTIDASASTPDPCSLLTTDEIDAATGLTFGDGAVNETVTQENQTACDWLAVTRFGVVQVLVFTVDVYDSNRASASEIVGVIDVSVPGASRAYVTEGGSIVGMDMGGTYLQVSLLSSDQPDVTEAALQLAAAAAGRLT